MRLGNLGLQVQEYSLGSVAKMLTGAVCLASSLQSYHSVIVNEKGLVIAPPDQGWAIEMGCGDEKRLGMGCCRGLRPLDDDDLDFR